MIDRAAFLHRVAARCRAGAALDPGDGVALARAIDCLLAGEQPCLDVALGLPHRRGQRSVATLFSKGSRDDLLRECAARFYSDKPRTCQAKAISAAATRYRAGAWQADRSRTDPPAGERGIFWLIYRGGEVIPQWRQLTEILKLQK